MEIPNGDIPLEILLQKNYVPYFPPFENELTSESPSDLENAHEVEVPAHFFYEFKYRMKFYMYFRL